MVISKKSIIFQAFRGSNIFQGVGSNFFQGGGGGGQSANFYRNPYNLYNPYNPHNPYPPSGSAHDCL